MSSGHSHTFSASLAFTLKLDHTVPKAISLILSSKDLTQTSAPKGLVVEITQTMGENRIVWIWDFTVIRHMSYTVSLPLKKVLRMVNTPKVFVE